MSGTTLGLRDWTRACRAEPSLRVGIILNQDARKVIALQLPGHAYELNIPGRQPATLAPHTALEIRRDGARLAVVVSGQPAVVTSDPVTLTPCALPDHPSPNPRMPGSGILVREVPAGRGFHWQKAIDQTYLGMLEISLGRHGLMLVNELPLEHYLVGVITAEMSGECPPEFLKAQCVTARSWLLANSERTHAADPFDRCNDDCCQRYQGTGQLTDAALAATRATRGRVLLDPTGNVLDANYSKCCGGITEEPCFVWGVEKPGIGAIVDAPRDAAEQGFFPVNANDLDEYLSGAWLEQSQAYCGLTMVRSSDLGRYLGHVDVAGDYFRWTIRHTRAELEDLLRNKLPAADLAQLVDLRVSALGVSGRACGLELDWDDVRGHRQRTQVNGEYRIRQVLHAAFLYSSAIAIEIQRDADGALEGVAFRGAGWGHGVGLCQIGALGMALSGFDHEAICQHYFPAAQWDTLYA